MRQPEMLQADGDGIKIQLAQWPGDGPPVLCIHGLTANCRSFDTIARALSPAHRVIAMDLRGRGRSDKPASGYSMDHHCRDIKAVLDNLGLDKVSLLGHSLGSYISLAYTAANPDQVDKLALLDGGANLTPEQWGKGHPGHQALPGPPGQAVSLVRGLYRHGQGLAVHEALERGHGCLLRL